MNATNALNAIMTGLIGFALPLILIALYIIYEIGSLPITIMAFTWLGFAIFFYVGVTDEDTAA